MFSHRCATLILTAFATLSAGVHPTRADDPPATPAARFAELKARFDADEKASKTPVKDPKTGEVKGYSVTSIPKDKYLPQLLELGKSADEAAAFAALTLASYGWLTQPGPDVDAAFDALVTRFAAGPRMTDLLREDRRHGYTGQDKRLAKLVAAVKDPTALTLALYGLAGESDPNRVTIRGEAPAAEDARRDKALGLYRRVVAEFPKVEKGVWAAESRRAITQLQQLRAGLPAPAIAGADSDGRPMTLAEFRGRVVVVDFWGSWCVPCVKKLPMMKEVAAKYAGKGVVFVGVMNEARAADAKTALERYKLPWRNWVDLDGPGGEPPIARAWGVGGFPSVYVVGRDGKFRFTRVDERDELERALDAALAETPAPPAKK